MSSIDAAFYAVYVAYFAAVASVLFVLRKEPLYEPRVLFTLAASLWLFIIHGYLIDFEGYLAAKPGFYSRDIKFLCTSAMGMMLIGYISFICGASLGVRLRVSGRLIVTRDRNLLIFVCASFVLIALINFLINVVLVSGGDIVQYLSNFAIRPYEVEDQKGISAIGYLFGFIGIQIVVYIFGRAEVRKGMLAWVVVGLALMVVVRFSQARIFQTLVLLGACYTSYSMGAAHRSGRQIPWIKQIHYLFAIGGIGVGIYFLRLASALKFMGISLSVDSVSSFSSQFVHFALERGNVPNFPVVLTIIDKIPVDVDFLYGKTLFNWALYAIPKSILASDYLISLWIKETWYLDIEGGGLPPTAVGEWYANFGIAGVVCGMLLVGTLLGALFKKARKLDSPYLGVLWANLAFGFIVIYPKTDLAQIPIFSLLILSGLWALMSMLRMAIGARVA